MSKKSLRKEMICKRDELSTNEVENFSKSVIKKVIDTDEYIKSENIFVFVSFNNEVFTHNFIKYSISNNKKIYIPYIENKEMKAVRLYDLEDLEIGFYNILSLPKEKIEIVNPEDLDLIIVPGLIFDHNLHRIGYGGGYYDKFLSYPNLNAYIIGICYDFQVIDEIDVNEYDLPVDIVITNQRSIERI